MIGYIKDLLRLSSGVRRFLMTEALYGLGTGIYSLVLNLHLLARGLSAEEVGALSSAGILIMGGAAIPVSLLAYRYGRKRLLVSGIALIACGNVIYAFAGGMPGFAVAQTSVSAGLTLVETTEVQLLFHYCGSRREEKRAYSLVFAVFTAFTGAGTLAAGWLSGLASTAPHDVYRVPLLAAAAVLAALGCLRGWVLPKERRGPGASAKKSVAARRVARPACPDRLTGRVQAGGERARSPLRRAMPAASKKLWRFALLMLLLGGAQSVVGSFLNIIVKYRMAWDDERLSWLLAANGFVLFIASLATPYLQERLGGAKAVAYVFAVNILVAALLYASLPAPAFAAAMLLRGGGTTMLSNLTDSELMSAAADNERNLYAGMRTVFRSVGSSGATYAAGWVLARHDYRLPFLITAAALLACLLYYARFIRPSLEREAA